VPVPVKFVVYCSSLDAAYEWMSRTNALSRRDGTRFGVDLHLRHNVAAEVALT
jgi:hypothetical protein